MYKFYFLLFVLFVTLYGCDTNDEEESQLRNEPYDKVIQAITISNNTVWVGTLANGLYKLNDEKWTNFTTQNGLISDDITALQVDKDERLWVGTDSGVSIFENEEWTNLTTEDGLYSNDIRSLCCDNDNHIWIGSNRNRVTKYDGKDFTVYHVNSEFSGDPGMGHIHTITCDLEGNVWTGSCMTGLSVFNSSNWTDYINNLSVFVTSSAYCKSGDVWIGHYMGANKYSNQEWTDYTEMDGLANATILCIGADQEDNIWVGTKNGISRFDGSSWTNYTVDDGPINEYVSSLACDSNGSVWVGSSKGLLKFTPAM